MDASSLITPQWVDAAAKATAAMGTLAFFVWKLFRGYHNVDLKASPQLERAQISEVQDCITITLKLAKGQNGTLVLHDLAARVAYDASSETKPFSATDRLSYTTSDAAAPRHAANWSLTSRTAPFLNLSPGDETSYATYFRVPRHAICTVEYTILGIRQGSRNWKCQWRGSLISVPKPPDAKA